jgi:hypothetical protein
VTHIVLTKTVGQILFKIDTEKELAGVIAVEWTPDKGFRTIHKSTVILNNGEKIPVREEFEHITSILKEKTSSCHLPTK